MHRDVRAILVFVTVVAAVLASLSGSSPASAQPPEAQHRPEAVTAASEPQGFGGTRLFGQALGGGGLTLINVDDVEPSVSVFFRAGVVVDLNALVLEVAPFTSWPSFDADPVFACSISYARYLRLSNHVFWRLGIGVGVSLESSPFPTAMQIAPEPVGIAFRVGPLLWELIVPSVRINFAPFDDSSTLISDWESFQFIMGVGLVSGEVG